jgi:hypothetical protein
MGPMPAPGGPGVQTLTGPQGYLPGLGHFGMPGGQGQPGILGPAPGQVQAYGAPPQIPPMPGSMPMPPQQQFFPPQQQAQFVPPQQQAQFFPPQQQAQFFPPQQAGPQGPPQVALPAPAMPPAMGAQGQGNPGQPHPFWMHLAWQLVQTPAVRGALGEQLDALLRDDRRTRTLSLAASTLAGPELQSAFRAMTGGSFQQTRFTELFAERLKGALRSAGV